MKSFYSPTAEVPQTPVVDVAVSAGPVSDAAPNIRTRARIAVYDALSAAPRIVDIEPAPLDQFIEALALRVHELARSEGGSIPYTIVREVAENFIHANFAEPVVSILDAGSTIRFADQGPGIPDKERALLPGFTTASGVMKRHIRGVGSGLPIVRDFLIHSGGSLAIEDNLGVGSIVTVYGGPARRAQTQSSVFTPEVVVESVPAIAFQGSFDAAGGGAQKAQPRLSARQKNVLALVLESGLAGPSLVSKELGVGISTAYRDLAMLEEAGLIASDGGKRTLTPEGLTYLGDLMNRS